MKTLFEILSDVSELDMDIDTAEELITQMFTCDCSKCPHCGKFIPVQSKNIINGNVENFTLGDGH